MKTIQSIHSLLGTSVLSVMLSMACALVMFAGTSRAQEQGGACGSIQSVAPETQLDVALRCTCGGGEIVLEGTQSWPGGGVSGSYKSCEGSVCQGYSKTPGYDTIVPGGNMLVVASKDVSGIAVIPSCDTSGCGKFLGFLWTIGSAKCAQTIKDGFSIHTHYVVVGMCPQPEGGTPGWIDDRQLSHYPLVLTESAIGSKEG